MHLFGLFGEFGIGLFSNEIFLMKTVVSNCVDLIWLGW